MVSTDSGEYALRIQRSKKYINKENEADKETIINDRRKTDNINIRGMRKGEAELNNKHDLRKEAEKITEKIFKGRDNNLYLERRKVEVFRNLNYKKDQRRQEQISTIKNFKEENKNDRNLVR